MAERMIHGFYSPDIFCALVVRASIIPMDDHDRKVIYQDMLTALTELLEQLDIGQAYTLTRHFYTQLSKLHVLREQYPQFKGQENAAVNTARLEGVIQRIDRELFIYNERVVDGGVSGTTKS